MPLQKSNLFFTWMSFKHLKLKRKLENPNTILKEIHQVALETGLFSEATLKVRLNPFKEHYIVGGEEGDFIHAFANIIEGKNTKQKANLSIKIIRKLKIMFPDVPIISINLKDFEKATYCK